MWFFNVYWIIQLIITPIIIIKETIGNLIDEKRTGRGNFLKERCAKFWENKLTVSNRRFNPLRTTYPKTIDVMYMSIDRLTVPGRRSGLKCHRHGNLSPVAGYARKSNSVGWVIRMLNLLKTGYFELLAHDKGVLINPNSPDLLNGSLKDFHSIFESAHYSETDVLR